jgi:acetyl-CoA carboxylase biotin carboxyl carrier protein
MVGTFYRRPAVDAEPYVEVGDSVKKGDVLCIVEAMKLMNEIECETTGIIKEVCLDDGQMVEFGEVIFRIEVN